MGLKREAILLAVRSNMPPAADLPDLDQAWITYDDKVAQFEEVLKSVGGTMIAAADQAEVQQHLRTIDAFVEAEKVYSLLPFVESKKVDWEAEDPHKLEDVDFAILPAQFGVVENGAVWVAGRQLTHRVVPFICQHLALVVPRDQLVDNMHQAYARLESTDDEDGMATDQAGFGVFISGPSKTADIEQSLVIGAHGARSLTVYLLGPFS